MKIPPWCDPDYDDGSVDIKWDFTQSLSILLNFGPAGWNNDLLFSQDYYNPDRCPNAWEIWDPFTQLCRPVECNPDYVLEHGECIWDGDSPEPPDGYDVVGYKTSTANITIQGNVLLPDSWSYLALPLLRYDIAESLSRKIMINPDRISGISVVKNEVPTLPTTTTTTPTITTTTKHTTPLIGLPTTPKLDKEDFHQWVLSEKGFPVTIGITLDRKEENATHELTIEQVLSVFHEAVTIRAVLGTLKGVPMKIDTVEKSLQEEEIDFFNKWCRGGDLKSYWNEAFEVMFVLKNKTEAGGGTKLEMAIQLKESGIMYDEGQYVANLLYQSSDLEAETANVSGVVILCENRPQIRDSACPRISLNTTEFTVESDGSLVYGGEIPGVMSPLNRSEYEFTDDGDIKICINYDEAKTPLQLEEPTLIEKIASVFTMVLMILSLLGLLATIVTYGLFPELRTLPGCCLIHLCIAEFAFFLIFISGARRPVSEEDFACTAVAVSLHLTALLFFTWSSVISYDLYVTFTKFQPVTRSREKYLWRYTIVGYGVPFFIIFSCLMVEFHTNHIISYGHHAVCWIGNTMASLYVFALPISISILLNAVFFILTVRGIRKVSRNSTASNLRAGGGSISSKDRARIALYVRMSSVQCFAWIFGFLTVSTHFDATLSTIFEFIFLFLSSLQGMYIFFAFVYNRRVKKLYKTRAFCQNTRDLNREKSTIISRMGSNSGSGSGSGSSKDLGSTKDKNTKKDIQTEKNEKKKSNFRSSIITPSPVVKINVPERNRKSKEKREKLPGNPNTPAERTVSNETCISIISND